MAKYVFIYNGGGGMPESPEDQAAAMAAWTAWFGTLGSAVADVGNPFGAAKTVAAGGTGDGASSGTSGYSIVTAADLGVAAELAGGCPLLASGGSVEVFEAIEM